MWTTGVENSSANGRAIRRGRAAVTFPGRSGPSVGPVNHAKTAARAAEAGRRFRAASPTAALALGAVLALLAAALIPLSLLARQSPLVNGGEALGAVLFAPVGVFLARRQPRNPIGWLFGGIAFCLLLSVDSGFYAAISYQVGDHLPLAPVALFLYQLWGPGLLLFALVVLLFPDGRLPSRFTRWILAAFVVVLLGFGGALIVAVAQAVLNHQVRLDAYDGLVVIDQATGWFALAQSVFGVMGVPFLAAAVARQAVAWRRSSGERRQQLKWLACGTVVAVFGLVAGLLVPGNASPAERALANVAAVGVVALPVSIAVAVLKYRLYEIDRIISRTLAYAIVTGLLVGVYAGLVLLATQVLSVKSPVAVAAATLATAALFNPVRHRVQRIVDRRFNRARYDAERTVDAFAAGLQGAVDLDSVQDGLVSLVYRVLEPAHVSVWVRDRAEEGRLG